MNAVQNNPVVTVVGGNATTLSTDVADFFEKRHDHVVRAIENIISNMPEDRRLNFQPTVVNRANPSGGAPIQSKAYRLTRDGFTFLAMGFTGERAQAFKWAYIDAFNQMERKLQQRALLDCGNRPPLTEAQRGAIVGAVNTKASVACVPKSEVWANLKAFFNVEKYTEIPSDNFRQALLIIDRLRLNDQPAPISSAPSPRLISTTELEALKRLHRFSADPYWKECVNRTYKVLRDAESGFAGQFFDLFNEQVFSWIIVERILVRNGFMDNYKS